MGPAGAVCAALSDDRSRCRNQHHSLKKKKCAFCVAELRGGVIFFEYLRAGEVPGGITVGQPLALLDEELQALGFFVVG